MNPSRNWESLGDTHVDALASVYDAWIATLTDVRARLSALKDKAGNGWKPTDHVFLALQHLARSDSWFAARQVETATCILDAAECDATEHKQRVERAKARVRILEEAAASRVLRIEPGDEAKLFASLASRLNAHWLDDWERVISYFEMKLVRYQAAHESRRIDFSGRAMPVRSKSAKRHIRGRFH